MTKTAAARDNVGVPPLITMSVLRAGYTWRTPLDSQALIEWDAKSGRWEWEITHGDDWHKQGTKRYLHSALNAIRSRDDRRYTDEFVRNQSAMMEVVPTPDPTIVGEFSFIGTPRSYRQHGPYRHPTPASTDSALR